MAAVSPELSYDHIARAVARDGLSIMGALHEDDATIVLLGPARGFWEVFQTAPEMMDGLDDPTDRWSSRVITLLAKELSAAALFPFGGPPYEPFISWALASGRAWSSPVGMLVHDEAGLMISFRGALRFDYEIVLPDAPLASPCDTCVDKPCTSTCPVQALSDQYFYKLDDCHAFLDTTAGQDCMQQGCQARRACPVSQSFDRQPDQSALHMRYFHR